MRAGACERGRIRNDIGKEPAPIGSHALVQRIALEHRAALLVHAERLCRHGNVADAEDLVQKVLLGVVEHVDRMHEIGNVRAWLMRSLGNHFIDMCRRRRTQPQPAADIEAFHDKAAAAEAESEADPRWAEVTPELLRAAVDRLDEKSREVFELFSMQGRSYDEIAAQLGMPRSTVGTQLRRARIKLKELLLSEPAKGRGRR